MGSRLGCLVSGRYVPYSSPGQLAGRIGFASLVDTPERRRASVAVRVVHVRACRSACPGPGTPLHPKAWLPRTPCTVASRRTRHRCSPTQFGRRPRMRPLPLEALRESSNDPPMDVTSTHRREALAVRSTRSRGERDSGYAIPASRKRRTCQCHVDLDWGSVTPAAASAWLGRFLCDGNASRHRWGCSKPLHVQMDELPCTFAFVPVSRGPGGTDRNSSQRITIRGPWDPVPLHSPALPRLGIFRTHRHAVCRNMLRSVAMRARGRPPRVGPAVDFHEPSCRHHVVHGDFRSTRA
ncbi:hypothetical protein SAMN04487916_11055 [Arthrobacter sp. ov407]|nr:hypothetical protein SAMN04487916_11055 [Arthrobacter sp. ov407]